MWYLGCMSDAVNGRRGFSQRVQPRHVRRATDTVVELEHDEQEAGSTSERLGEAVTAFFGSVTFVVLHVVWFGAWMSWNSGLLGVPAFDEFPFTFLTLIVSLEAIFLSTFVLISQNRQAERTDRRAVIDLEVNAIAEQELTKILKLVADIHRHVAPEDTDDPEMQEMLRTVHLEDIKRGIEEATKVVDAST